MLSDEMKDDLSSPEGSEEEAKSAPVGDSPDEQAGESKPEKKPGDWVTVKTPKVSRAKEPEKAAAASTAPPAKAEKPAPANVPAGPVAPAPPQAAAPKSTTAPSNVPLGSQLASMGVTDPSTQKIIVYGGGALLVLCCLCSCIAIAITFLGPAMGQ